MITVLSIGFTLSFASLAQLVEHSICNQAVVGSSPTRGSDRFYMFFLQCSAKETFQKNECTLGISYIQNNCSCLSGSLMLFLYWKFDRVDDCAGLENRRPEKVRGFESLSFRTRINCR